jgi:hypothetical protein
MPRNFNPIGPAILTGLGLVIIISDRVFGGDPAYFWWGVGMIGFAVVALTPMGRKLW